MNVFIGITKTMCLFFNLYHSLLFYSAYTRAERITKWPNSVLARLWWWWWWWCFIHWITAYGTTSRCNCSRVWKVPTWNYGSQLPTLL